MLNKYIPRAIEDTLKRYLQEFKVVTLTGPRQSGKTTLLRTLFPERTYFNLEDPEIRDFAESDPKGFLNQAVKNNTSCIIDEAQRVSELFSYIQVFVDQSEYGPGQIILSGSQNFLLMESISQSLAGRVGVLQLLPFSRQELGEKYADRDLYEQLCRGFYPDVALGKITPKDWYNSYIETYLEKDVRQLLNVTDLGSFRQFMKTCAARNGQLINRSALANDCGIANNTAKKWLSLLETSFLVQLVYPYHNNYGKRLVKTPKLQFLDSGVAATLCSVASTDELRFSSFKGGLFESFVCSEFKKCFTNRGLRDALYFWRDRSGREVDLIIDKAGYPQAIEAKSGLTITKDLLKPIEYFLENVSDRHKGVLIYGGEGGQERGNISIRSWQEDLRDLIC